MNHDDQQAIESLFQRLSEAERGAPARDAAAESFIARRIAEQPGAPYYMAQTIVVQQAALEQAQARIEDLQSRPQGGGFLASLFGGGQSRPAPAARPAQGPASAALHHQQHQRGGMGMGGGGFLAGAAQTAMGVAGGVLLGSALGGMFAGEAEAAEAPAETPAEEEPPQDEGFGDMGEDLEL